MKPIFTRKNAASTLEYVMLLTMIMAALYVSQKFIVRGFAGRWKQSADSFGFGKQYDPKKTIECVWSESQNRWYVGPCVDNFYDVSYAACMTQCNQDGLLSPCRTGIWNSCQDLIGNIIPDCCEFQCQSACQIYTDTQAINLCQTANGISCN